MTLVQTEPKAIKIGSTAVKKVYVGSTKVRPGEYVYTFDFQNDGQLNFTRSSDGGGNFGFTAGQGFYHYSSAMWGKALLPPTSIYDGHTLKKVKLWYYKGSQNTAIGINTTRDVATSTMIRYQTERNKPNYIGFNGAATVNIGTYTGEMTLEFNIYSDHIDGKINNATYTLTDSQSNNFITARANGTFSIMWSTWNNTSVSYLRKLEITTE